MDGSTGTQEAVVGGGGAAGTPMVCRWNPTKEQINILENLYGQGLRTPTAEQIQQITTRLQTYGHIEGKNVFYWFQNHKARQRQKEKQDHMSLFRQYSHHHLHHHQPFLPLSPSPNVVYEPCYIPHNNLGFHAHRPQVPLPRSGKRRSPRATTPKSPNDDGFMLRHSPESSVGFAGGNNTMTREQYEIVSGRNNYSYQETLDLFPLHPTGIMKERMDTSGTATCHASTACTSSSSGSAVDRLYFNFFA